jgi:hypothetical protein
MKPSVDPDVGGGIILKWNLDIWDRMAWTGFICLRIGTSETLL